MTKGNVGVDRYLGHSLNVDAHEAEMLASLLGRANVLHISTNTGWTAVVTNSGGTTQATSYIRVLTGATANSTALLHSPLYGFGQGQIAAGYTYWDKKLYFSFNIDRTLADANAVTYFHIKTPDTIGALAAKGLGLKVVNLALWGESFGTELGEVDLGVSLTAARDSKIVIVHDPGVSIKWYVDGVLKGTQSTAAKIPSGTSVSRVMLSTITGDPAVNAVVWLYQPRIWQKR